MNAAPLSPRGCLAHPQPDLAIGRQSQADPREIVAMIVETLQRERATREAHLARLSMGDDVENIDLLVPSQHPRHFPGGRLCARKHAHGYLRPHAP